MSHHSPRAALIQQLWQRWHATGRTADQNRLLAACTPLVERVSARRAAGMPAHIEVDDLIQAGWEAVVPALGRYVADRDCMLETFLWKRLNGAITDELRRQDTAPRSLRRWQRELEEAANRLAALLGRTPSDDELAAALRIATEELRERRWALLAAERPRSLDQPEPQADAEAPAPVERLCAGTAADDPAELAASRTAGERLARAFGRLDPRDRRVAVLLFVHDHSLRKTGALLGISEARVRQLRARVVSRLRAHLEPHRGLLLGEEEATAG